MGHWGVRSYENDDAQDALDAGFEAAHGSAYEELMDDGNPLSFEQVQEKLADGATLEHALKALEQEFGGDLESWESAARLAFAGVVVRLAECRVRPDRPTLSRALSWLRDESIEWNEPTKRRLRRDQEIQLLETLEGP